MQLAETLIVASERNFRGSRATQGHGIQLGWVLKCLDFYKVKHRWPEAGRFNLQC